MSERRRLTRLSRVENDPSESTRYFHPNGYVIVKQHRTWSERVGAMRGARLAGPLTWWTVYLHACKTRDHLERLKPRARELRSRRSVSVPGRTLADMRRWCDEHPREGWPTETNTKEPTDG